MAEWKKIVGLPFDQQEFDSYCKGLNWTAWRPSFIAIHNTGVPDLAMRPNGFNKQHIANLEAYYRGMGWRAGPHLFVDDHKIWVFTPLTMTGVHSPSWNTLAIGIEMLGDYATDSFNSGRGLLVRRNAVSAVASISRRLGLDPETIKLHKEDPKTKHNCPGKNVKKDEFIIDVKAKIRSYYPEGQTLDHSHPDD